ncbi:DUF4397 domain-containing protein [Flavivirga amylovorans]|uniref:DUF4397 domain-containing protein n=1 Tax=Flavivirga amylovorans TaxID=870486 RepID=A0ABT8X0T3_9FLAO|nr:DUF4397 domain-containing protein [Flavivirga amylovorans]MDO5987539.1 DUF4397 domain-containing protein [Flavivirga amylovorans]
MKSFNILIILLLICSICFVSCETSDDSEFPQAASLKVVHAINGAPGIYVENSMSEDTPFTNLPTLDFSEFRRFTLPARESIDIDVIFETDTTSQVASEQFNLGAGKIQTYFLYGDEANVSSTLVEDIGLRTITDSTNVVRFVNLTKDVNTFSVDAGGIDNLVSSIEIAEASEFVTIDATLENLEYTFSFKDEQGNELSNFFYRQWFFFPGFGAFVQSFQDTITFALVGALDDGQGNNTLNVIQIDQ